MLKPGDHIIYHRAGGNVGLKCILIDRIGDHFKIKLKVNYELHIFTEVVWDLNLQKNESIVLDKELYRNIKLNTLLGRDETK